MRKKLAWLLVGAMVLGTSLFGGCGKKVTAQSLVEEMNTKMKSVKSYEMSMDMDMSMNVEAQGIGMDLDLGMEGITEVVMEPMITHMDMTMEMSLLDLSMDMDMYMQVDGDQATTYMGLAGEWMKTTQPFTEELAMNDISFNVGDPEKLVLSDKTEMLDGGEAYVITGMVSGKELQSILASAESMMEGLGEVDLTGLQADMTLKIYKDTGYPASMEVIMSGEGLSTETDGTVVSITNLTVVTDYIGFDSIDSIEIPAEALAAPEVDANGMSVE